MSTMIDRIKLFQLSVARVCQNQPTKSDLEDLTKTTRDMVSGAEKTEDVKKALGESMTKLNDRRLSDKTVKDGLMSIFRGIDETTANLYTVKKPNEVSDALEKKISTLFNAKASTSKTTDPNTTGLRNASILQKLATQKIAAPGESTHSESTSQVSKPSGNFLIHAIREIQFHLSRSVHTKAIENIEQLTKQVETLNKTDTSTLTHSELRDLLKESRGAMQTAQDIIIDLSKYDDLSTKKIRFQIEELKFKLETAVSSFTSKMEELINSEKCENATTLLSEKGTEQEQEQFAKTIDSYVQTAQTAIALVQVDKNISEAQKRLDEVENAPGQNIEKTGTAIKNTSHALEQTTIALSAFNEVTSALPSTKKTNPFLAKLQNASKKLQSQMKNTLESPELKKALENSSPEVKKVFEEQIAKPAIDSSEQVEIAIKVIEEERPVLNELSENQRKLVASIQKTLTEESKLAPNLKASISTFAQRAIPLLKLIESKSLSKSDNFSVLQTTLDYCNILDYVYDELEKAGMNSKEDLISLNRSFQQDGIHDLAAFMAITFVPSFFSQTENIKLLVGNELLKEFDKKLGSMKQKHSRLQERMDK